MNNPSSQFLSDSQFLATYLNHPLRYCINKVEDTIHKASTLCTLKDRSTRKYLLTNQYESEISGLAPNDFIGLTIEDLISVSNSGLYEGGEATVKKIKEFDDQVDTNKSLLSHKELFVTHQGFLQWRSVIRIPVMGQDNKTLVAILTYEEDLTLREDLFELFKLYQNYYLKPQKAIEKFLGYCNVDTCFQAMPTKTEVHLIITMLFNPHHKEVAKLLNISYKTVAHHSYLLKSKLKEGTTLTKVVEKMRRKWMRAESGCRRTQIN